MEHTDERGLLAIAGAEVPQTVALVVAVGPARTLKGAPPASVEQLPARHPVLPATRVWPSARASSQWVPKSVRALGASPA